MKNSCIHPSLFGYFYSYCLNKREDSYEIARFIKIVNATFSLEAPNDKIFNQELCRKERIIEKVLLRLVKKNPDCLVEFENNCNLVHDDINKETDLNIIARNIAQSFQDAFYHERVRCNNKKSILNRDVVFINFDDIDTRVENDEYFSCFLKSLENEKCPFFTEQLKRLEDIVKIEPIPRENYLEYEQRVRSILKRACRNIDHIFKRGNIYPYHKFFIVALRDFRQLAKIKTYRLDELNRCLKESLERELLAKHSGFNKKKDKENYGYIIPEKLDSSNVSNVNNELIKEKEMLLKKYEDGEKIKFNRPFKAGLQVKKVDIINAYFDSSLKKDLNDKLQTEELAEIVMNLCEKADEIVDDMFKKNLCDAQISNDVNNYHDNVLKSLYFLYPPKDNLERYIQCKKNFEKVFKSLPNYLKDDSLKMIYDRKQQRHVSNIELIPSGETIINNLVMRKTRFVDSHAVEEFRHKALNHGKYLNYDLEVILRDVSNEDLALLYKKLKRNILYTNFVEEIKPGEDHEQRYREASFVQNKTLIVLQEVMAKLILNNMYSNEELSDMSYEDYQNNMIDIYHNFLNEEHLASFDFANDECEDKYREAKEKWDENSSFNRALHLIIANSEEM